MAYSATITRVEKTISGRRHFFVTIVEAEANNLIAAEWSITGFPFYAATLVSYVATRISGTGTQINPKLGKATGWSASTQDHIGVNTTTAAHINDETHNFFALPLGVLFGHSMIDHATADGVVHTELVFIEGEAA
jgi:hypothetical protein